MDTSKFFDGHAYFKELTEKNKLAKANSFFPCSCSGINSLQDVLDNFRKETVCFRLCRRYQRRSHRANRGRLVQEAHLHGIPPDSLPLRRHDRTCGKASDILPADISDSSVPRMIRDKYIYEAPWIYPYLRMYPASTPVSWVNTLFPDAPACTLWSN